MAEHNITVEGGSSVRLKTAGKYCDRDIVVTATGGSGGGGGIESGQFTVTENGMFEPGSNEYILSSTNFNAFSRNWFVVKETRDGKVVVYAIKDGDGFNIYSAPRSSEGVFYDGYEPVTNDSITLMGNIFSGEQYWFDAG